MGNEIMGRNMNRKTIERFLEDVNRCTNIIIISTTEVGDGGEVIDTMTGVLFGASITHDEEYNISMIEINMKSCSREFCLLNDDCIVSHCTDEDGDEQYMFSYERHCIEITLWNNYME